MKRKKGTFYIVFDWVIGALKLKGIEKDLFCIIYGFSQDGNSCFSGSIEYLCNRLGASKSAVFENLTKLLNKKFIIKKEYKKGCIKYCSYAYNADVVDSIQQNFQGYLEEDDFPESMNMDSGNVIPENRNVIPENKNMIPENNIVTNMESGVTIMESGYNNKVIYQSNKNKDKNKNITNSSSLYRVSAFDNTLKEKQKEEKELKKKIKNKTQEKMLEESISLDEITTEKISEINNDEAKQKQEVRALAAAEREAKNIKARRNLVLQNRLKEAKEYFTDLVTLDLLKDFIEQYQYTNNIFLSAPTWKYILKQASTIPEDILNASIENSIIKSYKSIYPISQDPVKTEKSIVKLTKEEQVDLEANLARNPDGSLMKF